MKIDTLKEQSCICVFSIIFTLIFYTLHQSFTKYIDSNHIGTYYISKLIETRLVTVLKRVSDHEKATSLRVRRSGHDDYNVFDRICGRYSASTHAAEQQRKHDHAMRRCDRVQVSR